MLNASHIQTGIDQFNQAKPEGDIDLVGAVRNLMLSRGMHDKVVSAFDTNRFIVDAAGKKSTVQQTMMNRFWSLQLAEAPDSIGIRCFLIPNGTVEEWLNFFDKKVLPFVHEHNLPKVI